MNILICDDYAITREGIKKLFEQFHPGYNIHQAENADEAIELMAQNQYILAIVDIFMPGTSGIELLKVIKQKWPKTAVLILSMLPDEDFALEALQLGASGYLSKRMLFEEINEAVKKALSGDVYITTKVSKLLIHKNKAAGEKPLHKMLTKREYDIMLMLSMGKSYAEIARQMGISINTIGTHRNHIIIKMKCKKNTDLTMYCVQHKLIKS